MRKFKVKVNGKEYEVEIEEIKTEPAEKSDKSEDKKEEIEKPAEQ
jgi:hypothetical protein